MPESLSRRSLLAAAGASAAGLLAACGSGTSSSAGSTPAPAGRATTTAGPFPVTIRHALGTATITKAPARVVTLGQGAAEAAIALGVFPVGIEPYAWGADTSGHLPWIREAYEKAGKALPAKFTGGQELDVEAVTALEPDLVLAPWSGLTQKQYDVLKDVAPVVAYEKTAWTTTWDGEIMTVATALGRPDEGARIVADLRATLARTAAEKPAYRGKTFSYIYTQGPNTLGVYMPTEQRVAMISALGLTADPAIAPLRPQDGSDWALIGLENADKLKGSDLVFTWYLDAATKKQVLSQPLYASIPAIRRDSVVTSEDPQLVTALSMINPLTVPWALPRLIPLIDAALAKL